jgi:cell wall assembly regulator SMI1
MSELEDAYRDLIGPPVATRELGDGVVALFAQPSDDDELPDDEWVTYVATAGLSRRAPFELLMRVHGRRAVDSLVPLARAMAQIGRAGDLAPGQVIDFAGAAPFARMPLALLSDFVPGEPEWLPGAGASEHVRVIQLHPLFATEAAAARLLGEVEVVRASFRDGVDLTDPDRGELALVVPDLDAIWADIEAWLDAHAPRAARELRPGATAAAIASLERALGRALPDDYKASLARHDGRVALSDQEYLSTDAVAQRAASLRAVAAWDARWIPFASDSGGNLLCLDERGRVFAWEAGDTGPVASSFGAWLSQYRDDLLAGGVYGPDDDGIMTRL